jgi:hypothetical protein
MVKARRRVIYEFSDGSRRTTVEFVRPAERNPGWSHRVAIDGVLRDWLYEGGQPNLKAARFYYEKHLAAQTSGVRP